MARLRKSIVNTDSETVNNPEVTDVAEEQQSVKVYSPIKLKVMRQDHTVCDLSVGINEVPADVADHWYAVAHGVKRV